MFKDTSVWCIILVIIVIMVAYHIKNDVIEGAKDKIDPQNSVPCGECVVAPIIDSSEGTPPCTCPPNTKGVKGEGLYYCEPSNKCKTPKGNDIQLLKDYRGGGTPAAPGTPGTPGTPGSAAADSTVSKILKFVDDTIQKRRYSNYDIHSSVSSYKGQGKIMSLRTYRRRGRGIRRRHRWGNDKLDSNGCKTTNIQKAMRGCNSTKDCMGFTVDKKNDTRSNSPSQKICFKKNIDIFSAPTKVNDSEKALFVKDQNRSHPIDNHGRNYYVNNYVHVGRGYKGFEGQEKYIGMDGANLDVEGCKTMTLNNAERLCDKDSKCSGFSSKMSRTRKNKKSEVCFKKNIDINKKLGKEFGSNQSYLYIKKKNTANNCSSLIRRRSGCKSRSTLKKCLKSCKNKDTNLSCSRIARFNGPNGSRRGGSCNNGSVTSYWANQCRETCKNRDKSRACKSKAERRFRSKKRCNSSLRRTCPQSCKDGRRQPFVQKGRRPGNWDYAKLQRRSVVMSKKWKMRGFRTKFKGTVGERLLRLSRSTSPNQAKKICNQSKVCAGFTIAPRRSPNQKGTVVFFRNHKGSGRNGLRPRSLKTRYPGSYAITTKGNNGADTYIKDAKHYNKYSETAGFNTMGSLSCVNNLTHSDAKSYCSASADCDGFFAYSGNSPADNMNRDGKWWVSAGNNLNLIQRSRESGGRGRNRKMAPGTKYNVTNRRTVESTWSKCRNRCKRTPGCRYYNWFPNKGCHINDGRGGLISNSKNPTAVRGEIKKPDWDLSTEGRVCFKKNIFSKGRCSPSRPCNLPKPKLNKNAKLSEKSAFYTKIGHIDSQRRSNKVKNWNNRGGFKLPTRGDNESNYYK